MTHFSRQIREAVDAELTSASAADAAGEPDLSFHHLERAHVLGQASTYHHVRAHWAMLLWGIRQRSLGEVVGQLFRLVGAATKTVLGLVPQGNTGGSNISPFRRLPVEPELRRTIEAALQRP